MPVDINGTTGVTTPGLASTTMPTVAGDPIVESGSNTDGRWVKFSEGILICQKNSHTASATEYTTWFYPVAEISGIRGLYGFTNTSNFNDAYFTSFGNPINTEVPVQVTKFTVNTGAVANAAVGTNLTLIGRWK